MDETDFSQLKNLRLFAGLSLQELESIASRGTVRKLRKKTVFIERNETSSTLYLILSGKVKVYLQDSQGNEQLLRIHCPGDHLGEIALLTDAVRTASAATLEDTALLVLSRRAFVECLSDYPQIALNLDTSLEQRVLSPDISAVRRGCPLSARQLFRAQCMLHYHRAPPASCTRTAGTAAKPVTVLALTRSWVNTLCRIYCALMPPPAGE